MCVSTVSTTLRVSNLPMQEACGAALTVSASLSSNIQAHPAGATAMPQSAAQVMLNSTHATLLPSVCGPGTQGFASALWHDGLSILALGRSAVVCAVADLHCMLEVAGQKSSARPPSVRRTSAQAAPGSVHPHPPASTDAGEVRRKDDVLLEGKGIPDRSERVRETGSAGPSRKFQKAVQAAARKAWFLLIWANEQPDTMYEVLHNAVARQLADTAKISKETSRPSSKLDNGAHAKVNQRAPSSAKVVELQ